MNNTTILETVREAFEEQKGIKILSLYFSDDKRIEGIYIVPPNQSLSFVEMPLLNMMCDDVDGYRIILEELGEVLRYSYKMGSIYHFDKLLIDSEIDCANNLFNKLVSYCKVHSPMLLMKTNFIKWIDKTDEVTAIRTQSFINQCATFNKLDELDYDENIDKKDASSILNEFNYVKQQLKEKKYDKNTELQIHLMDNVFVQMQIDLYTTDDIL